MRVLDLPGLDYTFAETQANINVVLGMAVVTVTSADVRMQVVTQPDFHADETETIRLSFDPTRTLLFDTASGKVLANGPQ